MYEKTILIIYAAYLVLMSLIAFVLYGVDKKKAMSNSGPDRIKEKVLLSAAVFGGSIGAFVGRIFFHHKTEKSYFTFTILLSLLCQAAALVALIVIAF